MKNKSFNSSMTHLCFTSSRANPRARAAGSAGSQTRCIADFQVGRAVELARLGGLETRDTADLEVCATKAVSSS